MPSPLIIVLTVPALLEGRLPLPRWTHLMRGSVAGARTVSRRWNVTFPPPRAVSPCPLHALTGRNHHLRALTSLSEHGVQPAEEALLRRVLLHALRARRAQSRAGRLASKRRICERLRVWRDPVRRQRDGLQPSIASTTRCKKHFWTTFTSSRNEKIKNTHFHFF